MNISVKQYGLFGVLLVGTLTCGFGLMPLVFAEEPALMMEEVSYTTADNTTIYGSWIVPQSPETKSGKAPAVILLHDYGADRRDWGVLIPDLVVHGYQVLAIDLRGHGKSAASGTRVSGQYLPQTAAYIFETGYADIQGGLEWLKRRKDTDPKRISLVGVGLGADIAYFCAGRFKKQIKSSVVISPSLFAVSEGKFTEAVPRAILFCVSARDTIGASMMAAESLANFTQDPKKVVIYDSAAHGLAMFYKHPEIKQEILAWIGH